MRCVEEFLDGRQPRAEDIVRALDKLQTPADARASPARWPHAPRRGVLIATSVAGLLIFLGGAAAIVPSGTRAALFTLIRRPDAVVNARPVLLAPVDNQTGDTSLDAPGPMTADWI